MYYDTWEGKMAKASDVAKYLLTLVEEDADEMMTNMKLQKLLYYCQGFHLALKNKKLFNEPLVAWLHGPVVEEIYHEYKDWGGNGIPRPEDFNDKVLTKSEKDVINQVYSVYGQFSAWGLRNMTHNEPPWMNTDQNCEISEKLMKDYFSTKIA